MNITVAFRTAVEADAVPLGEVPFTTASLDAVIPTIQRWGDVIVDGVSYPSLAGQIETDSTGRLQFVIVADTE